MTIPNRLALKLEYAGAGFCGSQYQTGVRTVQDDLERALSVLAKQPIRVAFAGRTDSGVHATGQVAHCDWPVDGFNTCTSVHDASLPDLHKLSGNLNGILCADLAVIGAQWVPAEFHARFSATCRSYVYKIANRTYRSPLLKSTHYFVPGKLDIEVMQAAARCLIGEHDFSAFKSSSPDRQTAVCRVTRAEILNLGEGVLEFRIEANRFVYNMVRVIVGTLVEIGLGKRPFASLERAINSAERNEAGPTAPAWGLCLTDVQYPAVYHLFKLLSDSYSTLQPSLQEIV